MSKRTLVYLLICCFCYGLMASNANTSDRAKTLTEYFAPTTDFKDTDTHEKAIVTDPVVTISTPADGAEFPVGTDLTVEASATDNGSIRNIRLIMNDETIRKINGSSGIWGPPNDPELANLEAGTYEIRVVAVDNQGNTGEAIHTITVSDDVEPENIPPTVTITAPTDGSIFLEGNDINVTAIASDSDGNVTGVELFLDDASQGAVTSVPYSWILSDLAVGSYMLRVVATDDEDATSEQIISITIREDTGENIPPTVSFTNPSDGDTFIEGDDLTVTATASDLDGNITGVEFLFDGNSQGTDNTTPYEWSLQNLAVGTYNLQVIATDDSSATDQQTISITVEEISDDGIPRVIISTPDDGDTFPVGTDLTVEASATDSDGTIRNIRLLVNETTIRKINGASGTWGPPNDPELANLEAGTYDLRVVAIDNQGNRGEATHTITVVDDNGGENRPPSVSFASPSDGTMFIVGNDIGVEANASDADGTVEQIELFLDDASQGTEALAPYEWTLSNLAVGTYTLRVVATDNDGATDEESISITVKEDDGQNVPPTVSLTNPSDGDMFDQGADLTVTASASDADGSVSQVELFANGDSQGTETLAPYEWDLQNLPSGSYELRVVATDDDGATAEATINITVREDNTGGDGTPVVTISTPADGANFPVGTDLTVEASATDSDGSIRNIRLLVNGTTIRKINGTSGTWGPPTDPELANLDAGTYELQVVAIDNRGNRGEKIHTITVGDDNGGENRPPMVDITSPDDGDTFFVGNNIQVEATASDSDGSISQLELFLNDDSQGTEVLAPYQWILEGLAVGSYTMRVVATDNEGATSEDMISITVREDNGGDNLPPTVSFTNPSDGDMFDQGADLTVTADASDSDGSVTQVELFANGDSQGTEALAPYEWDLQNLPSGSYELRVVATDDDGETAESTINITVKEDNPVDDGTPIVTISTPADGASLPVGADLNVEASATDSDGTIRNIRLLVDGTTIRKINGPTGSWGPPEDPELADLEAGTYELQVVAVDNSGKRGEKTHTIRVSGDGGDNLPPSIDFVRPDDGESFMQGEDVAVEIATSDMDGSIASVELFVDDASQGTLTNSPFEWTLSNLSVGTHELKATSTDDDGASSDAMVTISVDPVDGLNIPPTVSFTNPSNGDTLTEGDNLTVTASASDSDGSVTGVEFIFDGSSQGTDNTAPYEWSLTNLAVGNYDLQVVATDDSLATEMQTISITVEEEDVMGDGNPVVTISTPEEKELVPVDSDLVVEASATDDGSVRNVRLFFDGSFVRKINGSTGRWSVDDDPELANLSEGEHTVRVVAVDNQGNTGETTHTIYASPISASFVQPTPNQIFSEGSDVVVEVSASTTEGRIRRVELFMNNEFIRTESVAPYEWGLESQSDEVLANMLPGDYALVASVISNRGDTAEICTNFTIEASSLGLLVNEIEEESIYKNSKKDNIIENRGREKMMNVPPVTTIHLPTDGQTFTAGTDLTVTASATDEDGRVRNIRLYFDDDFVRKINGDTGEWNADSDPELANLQVGEHTIRVGAVDNGGASSEVIITINVVDDGENVPPTVSFLEPTDGQAFPEGTDLNVEVAASDSDGSITGVDLYINDNFVRNESLPPYIWGSATPNTDLPLQDLPAGMHELKAIATDNEGATTTETIMIIVEGEDDGGGDNGGGDNGGGGHTDDDQTVGGEDGIPITTIVSPRDGDVLPVGSDLTVVAEASDPDGRVRNVRMYLNDAFISKINRAPYEWTADEHSELANLQEGSYDIRVGSVDNSGKSSELTITITVSDEVVQNDAPSVSFDAPLDGAEVTTGDDVAVEVSASDNDGTITGVEFFLDDVLVSNDDTAPYEWTVNAISEGAHTLKAVATDNDGATSETSISITAITEQDDNISPTVSFTAPSDGDSFMEGDDLSVTATASDEDGSVAQVEFFFEDASQGTDDEAPYEWTYEGLTAGDYDLKVVATDDEGATAESTISITVEGEVSENTPPTVSFTAPSDGDGFTEGDNLNVTATASDEDGSVAQVEFFFEDASQGTDDEAPYEWTYEGLTAGDYDLKVVATDDEGATAESIISITVEGEVSENTPPTVSFTAPSDGDGFTEGDNLNVTATASDEDGSVAQVEFFFEDASQGTDDEAPYEWTYEGLTAGDYDLKVVATDDEGATAESIISITVEGEVSENTPPTVSFITPNDGDVFTEGDDLSVTVTASDADGSVTDVELYYDDNLVGSDEEDPYTWMILNLTEGTHTLRAKATDNEGAETETSISITVEAEDTGGGSQTAGGEDGTPITTIISPTDGDVLPIGSDLTVIAEASDPDGRVRNVRMYLNGDFISKINNPPYEWSGNEHPELANLQEGSYDIRVGSVDNSGKSSEVIITIIVSDDGGNNGGGDNGGGDNGGGGTDEVDPVVSFDKPSDGQTFEEGDDIHVTANASDEDGTITKVDLFLDGEFVRTETNAPYDWGDQPGQDTELENMQPGMYDLRVVATDNDGNTDTETITITVNEEDDGGGNNGGGSTEGAQISIENRTKLPILETSFPADDIYSFCHVNKPSQTMTDEHNRNTMRIHSTGTANLVISQINISDTSEYTLPNNDWDNLPITIAPGQSYDLLIQFVESRGSRGFRGQSIELITNDEDNPSVSAELRGAYNIRPEGNNEPHVRTIIQALGFKTDIGGNLNTGLYPNPEDVEAGDYGDLVLSEVWERADPNEPVIGVNLAVYKGGGQTQGSGLNTRFVNVDNLEKVGNFNFNTCSGYHQSILAKNQNCRSYDLIAGIERNQVDVPFRIVMDGYISDGKGDRDPVTGRRQLLAIRMFQVIDPDGNVIPNHYIALNDYVKNGCSEADGALPTDEFANCDWNDNITYFINIQPVNPLAIGNMSIEEVEQRFGKIARQQELRAYPNPTQQELNVDLTSFMDEEVNLTIQDQVGKIVQLREFDNNHSMIENLDLGQMNPGFYILTLQSGDVQLTKKIIVNKQ